MNLLIFCLLLSGCVLLGFRVHWLEAAQNLMRRSREGLDEAARRRLLENRRQLLTLQKEHSVWYRLEQELNYSGWKRWFPFLTAELWVAGNVFCAAVLGGVLLVGMGWKRAVLGIAVLTVGEYLILSVCKARAFRKVNTNLIKFLDFLGNYSITAGELTGIFTQISKYVEEPLRSALDECSYEAQTTGDTSLALLSMAEKIEHPKFKELVRNMEISVRYCADFTLLVNSSRRIVREYLRMVEERKSLMREAMINMLLLLVMSAFTLVIVDGLLETSIWELLVKSLPGRIALGITAFILFLFAGKLAERR
jgi:Flp pilus assembly protein TadB